MTATLRMAHGAVPCKVFYSARPRRTRFVPRATCHSCGVLLRETFASECPACGADIRGAWRAAA